MPSKVFAFRPTEQQLELLRLHQWEGEARQNCINRLLRRLDKAIASGRQPEQRPDPTPRARENGKYVGITFRPDPRTREIVEKYWQGGKGIQATMDYLLGMALQFTPWVNIETPSEALGLLRSFQSEKVDVLEAIAFLEDYCTENDARRFLWELHEAGKIRLVILRMRGAVLGPGTTQYGYLKIL